MTDLSDNIFAAARRALEIDYLEQLKSVAVRQDRLESRMSASERDMTLALDKLDEIAQHLSLAPLRGGTDPVARILSSGQSPHA